MSDADKSLQKRFENLQEKYQNLRRNHRKLAGVALQLVEALEAFVKDEGKPDIRMILLACSRIYPGLMNEALLVEEEAELNSKEEELPDEGPGKGLEEKDCENSEEYFEGFWSRPKIPRTPQV